MFESIEFPSNDQLEAPIPAGTEAIVKARLNRDGELQIRQGKTKAGKDYMSVPFVIEGGDYDARYCSLMLTVDAANRYFRAAIEMITEIDLADGGKVTDELFREKLLSAHFRAEVSTNDRGYVNVDRLLERIPTDGPAPVAIPVPAGADESGVDDDDIPF